MKMFCSADTRESACEKKAKEAYDRLRCAHLRCAKQPRVGRTLVPFQRAAHLEVDEEVGGVLDVIVFAHLVLRGGPGAEGALSRNGVHSSSSRGIDGAGSGGAALDVA